MGARNENAALAGAALGTTKGMAADHNPTRLVTSVQYAGGTK